jgi:hypothetical protein
VIFLTFSSICVGLLAFVDFGHFESKTWTEEEKQFFEPFLNQRHYEKNRGWASAFCFVFFFFNVVRKGKYNSNMKANNGVSCTGGQSSLQIIS